MVCIRAAWCQEKCNIWYQSWKLQWWWDFLIFDSCPWCSEPFISEQQWNKWKGSSDSCWYKLLRKHSKENLLFIFYLQMQFSLWMDFMYSPFKNSYINYGAQTMTNNFGAEIKLALKNITSNFSRLFNFLTLKQKQTMKLKTVSPES